MVKTVNVSLYGESHIPAVYSVIRINNKIIEELTSTQPMEKVSHIVEKYNDFNERYYDLLNTQMGFYQSFKSDVNLSKGINLLLYEYIPDDNSMSKEEWINIIFKMYGLKASLFNKNNIFALESKTLLYIDGSEKDEAVINHPAYEESKKKIMNLSEKFMHLFNYKSLSDVLASDNVFSPKNLLAEGVITGDYHVYREGEWLNRIAEVVNSKINEHYKTEDLNVFVLIGEHHLREGAFFGVKGNDGGSIDILNKKVEAKLCDLIDPNVDINVYRRTVGDLAFKINDLILANIKFDEELQVY